MDETGNGFSPMDGGDVEESNSTDWRSKLQSDFRQRIIHKIIVTLNKHAINSGGKERFEELKRSAVQYEERIYHAATSNSDYLQKISMKIHTMEQKISGGGVNGNSLSATSGAVNQNPSPVDLMEHQLRNQGPSTQVSVTTQSQSRQLLAQDLKSNISSTTVQGSCSFSPELSSTEGMTQANISSHVENQNKDGMPVITQNSLNNIPVQSIPQNMYASSQSQMQERHQRQSIISKNQQVPQNHILYEQELIKQSSLFQSQIPQQQQKQPVLSQSQLQSCQQPLIQMSTGLQSGIQQNQQNPVQQPASSLNQKHPQSLVRQQQSSQQPNLHLPTSISQKSNVLQANQQMGHQSSLTNIQQNQLLGQHNNLSDVQKLHQHQRLSNQQNGLMNMQQPQQMINQQNISLHQKQQMPQSNVSGIQQQSSLRSQHQSQILGSTISASNMQSQNPNLRSYSNVSGQDIQQTSSVLMQLQDSVDSPDQTSDPSIPEWREDVYQEVLLLKETYYSDINNMHQNLEVRIQQVLEQERLLQSGSAKQELDRLMKFKSSLERFLHILLTPKQNIPFGLKDNIQNLENKIVNMLSNRPRKGFSQGQQKLQHSQGQVGGDFGILQQSSNGSSLKNNVNSLNAKNANPLQCNNLQYQVKSGNQQQKFLMQKKLQQQLIQQRSQQKQSQHEQLQQKQQPNIQLQGSQMQQHHPINEMNELNIRQISSSKPIPFNPSCIGQRQTYNQQEQKIPAPLPISSLKSISILSPQISQHSSAQMDQQSVSSPTVNPSSPVSSNQLIEHEKQFSNISSFSNPGNAGPQQSSPIDQYLSDITPGISVSSFLDDEKNVTERPLEYLIRMVGSSSPNSLASSATDIGSVVHMIDRFAGSAPGNGSRASLGEDLVATTRLRMQSRNLMLQDGSFVTTKMKKHTTAMQLNGMSSVGSVHDSLKRTGIDISEFESTATSRIKRAKMEANHALLEEIRFINQHLIDTSVDIIDEDIDSINSATEAEGTVVKFTYLAVSLSPTLKLQFATSRVLSILPLLLVIPPNYPSCSPVLLEKIPAEISNEPEDLSAKVKSSFSKFLCGLSSPTSLKEMATSWDLCVRKVVLEYAQLSGGGTFSSKYGTWKQISKT